MSDSLRHHESHTARPPCPSPTPGVYSNSCPSSWWCHPAVSSSVIPFSSCCQSLPVSGSFPMSQLLRWPKYWSFSFSISPSNEHPGLISFSLLWAKWVKVAQSFPTLCDHMGYTVHGILQARILEWVAFPFFRGSSQPRDWTQVSCIAGRFFTSWATREALYYNRWESKCKH